MGHDYVRQFRSKHVDVELADPVPMLVHCISWSLVIYDRGTICPASTVQGITQCELALSAESGVNNDLVQVNHTTSFLL